MIVVTGGAGFIGSCVLSRLNDMGRKDIVVVDHLDDPLKEKNLDGKSYQKFLDKTEFIELVRNGAWKDDTECVIHMGACSSTTLQDADYFESNNFEYTRDLAQWAIDNNIRFIYASSAATYGDGSNGYCDSDETTRKCRPLNLYGMSKQKFDLWLLERGYADKAVGLKFFNVFGPNEYHKGDMKSVVAKAYDRVVREGKMALFKSYKDEFGDGEQKRDFIYVKDAVDIVIYFQEHPEINGIFNVGTGQARTWNDLAKALFAAVGKNPVIEYIDMPDILKDKYQYFTQADMSKLRKSGYVRLLSTLEDSVKDYVGYLKTQSYL